MMLGSVAARQHIKKLVVAWTENARRPTPIIDAECLRSRLLPSRRATSATSPAPTQPRPLSFSLTHRPSAPSLLAAAARKNRRPKRNKLRLVALSSSSPLYAAPPERNCQLVTSSFCTAMSAARCTSGSLLDMSSMMRSLPPHSATMARPRGWVEAKRPRSLHATASVFGSVL